MRGKQMSAPRRPHHCTRGHRFHTCSWRQPVSTLWVLVSFHKTIAIFLNISRQYFQTLNEVGRILQERPVSHHLVPAQACDYIGFITSLSLPPQIHFPFGATGDTIHPPLESSARMLPSQYWLIAFVLDVKPHVIKRTHLYYTLVDF